MLITIFYYTDINLKKNCNLLNKYGINAVYNLDILAKFLLLSEIIKLSLALII